MKRSEGFVLFGLRITRHPDYKDVLQKGELRPELANLLCLISEPNKEDVFLDPFSGSGSIPRERTRFPYKEIITSDLIPVKITRPLKIDLKVVEVLQMSALNMTKILDNSVDKIVTNPPWGIEVGKELDLPKFYSRMTDEFQRVLRQTRGISSYSRR